jgi:cytochrome c
MKKYFLLLIISAFITSCGNKQNNEDSNKDSKEGTKATGQQETATRQQENEFEELDEQDILAGGELINSSDCKTCHQIEQKLIGPAYKDVAEKYTYSDTTVTYLAGKIIEGGSGNWGEIPMIPHPQHSQKEAEQMATYILSLRNE